jgi:Shwachman-Bodian-Diamond syndrome (SBDS) protein
MEGRFQHPFGSSRRLIQDHDHSQVSMLQRDTPPTILRNRRHGAQGKMDGASKATLENEFGTSDEDECIKQILTKGQVQRSEVS